MVQIRSGMIYIDPICHLWQICAWDLGHTVTPRHIPTDQTGHTDQPQIVLPVRQVPIRNRSPPKDVYEIYVVPIRQVPISSAKHVHGICVLPINLRKHLPITPITQVKGSDPIFYRIDLDHA